MKLHALILIVLAVADRWIVRLVDGSDRHVPYFRKLVEQKDPKCSAHKACNRTSGNWYEYCTGLASTFLLCGAAYLRLIPFTIGPIPTDS